MIGRATLVFDGDQTLWDFESAMIRALGETRIEISRVTGLDLVLIPSVAELIATRRQLAAARPEESLLVVRRAAFEQTLKDLGGPAGADIVARVTNFYIGRRHEMCRPYLDTVPALTQLRQAYSIVLLSNGNSNPERIGLGGFFDHLFFAEAIGVRKPDPQVYEHVARASAAGVLVSVGDSITNDIVAPQRAGWHTVWINRDDAELPDGVRPDATLTGLSGLAATLETLIA